MFLIFKIFNYFGVYFLYKSIKIILFLCLIIVANCNSIRNLFVFKPYNRGINAENDGNYDAAINYYMQDIQRNPEETRSRLALADVFYRVTFQKIQNNTVSISDLKNTIITNKIAYEIEESNYRNDTLHKIFLVLIEKYIQLDDFDNAHNYIERAEKLFPNDEHLNLLKGKILSLNNKKEEEIFLYRTLIQSSESLDIDIVNNLIILLNEEKQYDESKSILYSLISDNPNNDRLYFLLGSVYLLENDWENAENYFNSALKIKKDINSFVNIAYVQLHLGKFADALENYEKALEINPINVDVFFGLGNLFFLQEDYRNSIEFFEKAIIINSEDIFLLHNLANAYMKNNNFNNAVSTFENILSIDPYNSLAYENIIYIYREKLNNIKMSDYFLERYRVVNPEGYEIIKQF